MRVLIKLEISLVLHKATDCAVSFIKCLWYWSFVGYCVVLGWLSHDCSVNPRDSNKTFRTVRQTGLLLLLCKYCKQRDGIHGRCRFSLHIRSPRFRAYRRGRGGGYSGVNFGHLKCKVFHFLGGGVFWSKLWSSQIWSFSFWRGGGSLVWNSRKGLSGEFGHKIYCLRNVYTNLFEHHR